MSWLSTLYETYQNMSQSDLLDDLLPIAHTTQQAHIEVTINELAEFVDARVVAKEDAETVIPCTEQSAGRAGSHPVNHPLMDKLQYVAGDYTKYGGEKGAFFHKKYMEDLSAWCDSEYANPKVKILYQYLKKGSLIYDLIQSKILYCDANNKLLKQYPDKENVPQIFKVLQGAQSDAFVRFRVNGIDERTALWQDPKLKQDYIHYYLNSRKGESLCYVSGKKSSCSVNHPSKLRNPGDMAKLISANDTDGFTFRGRFLSSNEAVGISYEVSQGAHNALKWLIKNQGRIYGSRVYVIWNPKGYEVPEIDKDSWEALTKFCEKIPNTAYEFAEEFHKAMSGYRAKFNSYDDQIVIMGIDAATTGRMAITFYREELANELIENLENWHNSCAWKHKYRFSEERKAQEFYGAPSPNDIALAAFGMERNNRLDMDDKLRKNIVERILNCIIDNARLPYDIVSSAYSKVVHPQNYKEYYNWYKVLTICCALLKKYYYDISNMKEVWTVELDEKNDSLPYLCGRLLAVADALEKSAYSEEEKKHRTTNAMRYFTKFVEHPCQTWDTLNRLLQPYIAKLGGNAVFFQKIMGTISKKINPDEFLEAKNLDGRMAIGFYAQLNDIYTKKKKNEQENSNNSEESKED